MNRNLIVSKALTVVSAAIALSLAIMGPWLVEMVCAWYGLPRDTLGRVLLYSGYVCALVALAALCLIYAFLSSVSRGEVFSPANVRRLRAMSALCAAAGLVAVADAVATRLCFLAMIALAALFMALLVRVVGDAFDRALGMKNELDLTI